MFSCKAALIYYQGNFSAIETEVGPEGLLVGLTLDLQANPQTKKEAIGSCRISLD